MDINRRDFLNGFLIGAGRILTRGSAGLSFLPGLGGGQIHLTEPASINQDRRALRGGNTPSGFMVGHWMRDQRLTFEDGAVRLSASRIDSAEGRFDIIEDHTAIDVVVLGSGMSGLSAAFYLSRQHPGIRIAILDANVRPGGNSGLDRVASGRNTITAATGGAYACVPYADFLREIYSQIGIEWEKHLVAGPFYSYFFDEHTPHVLPGTRAWTLDVYGGGLKKMPYPAEIVRDLQAAKEDFQKWSKRAGGPTDPADNSSPEFDFLAQMTLHDYLIKDKQFHPALSDYYTRFAIDALGGTTEQVNAHAGISFLGAEYGSLFAFPGGNGEVAVRLTHWLAAHRKTNTPSMPQIRQGCIALRADTDSQQGSVVFFQNGKFFRIRAKAIVIATQSHAAKHIVGHLVDANRRQTWRQIIQVPVVVANVSIRSAAPLVRLGLGYNQYWWGSRYWADFVTADWVSRHRSSPNRPTVLTVYGGNTAPPEEMASERLKLMSTPFMDYENSLRDDLNRVLAAGGFDFDRDVTSIYLYRWGHGMLFPTVGFAFGAPQSSGGKPQRTPAPRHLVRERIGRIFFAGQDTEGTPSMESAIGSGHRVAQEILSGGVI